MKELSLVKVLQTLFGLNAAFWLLLGGWYLLSFTTEQQSPRSYHWLITTLMLANGLALSFIAWDIGSGRRITYYLGVFVLLVNILLALTDDFGAADLFILILDLLSLLFLVSLGLRLNRVGKDDSGSAGKSTGS